ncbi:hypothetical protein ACP4OV_028416 [Aristida adscensionis]
MANLVVLAAALLALLGSVACQGYYPSPSPNPNPNPAPGPSSTCRDKMGWALFLGPLLCSLSPSSNSNPIPSPAPSGSTPTVGYYNKNGSCPSAEYIVRKIVADRVGTDKGLGSGLIRLFFHDCFVQGCDASVLLDDPTGANTTEKFGGPNANSLRESAFKLIDDAKAALEAACPGTVSCADIVAFAARDASDVLSNGTIRFDMPAGRYDGRVSLATEANTKLPGPGADIDTLKQSFGSQGLDANDLVTLSGAHSIGVARCRFISAPGMEPMFRGDLNSNCTKNGPDSRVNQDYATPNELDKQYYNNVIDKKVLFASDAALLNADDTRGEVAKFASNYGYWETEFGEAMKKMGSIGVKSSANGEIRKQCRRINTY